MELNAQSEVNFKISTQRNSKSNLQNKPKQSEGALSVSTLSNEEFRKRVPSHMKAKYKSGIKTPQQKKEQQQRKTSEHMLTPSIKAISNSVARGNSQTVDAKPDSQPINEDIS